MIPPKYFPHFSSNIIIQVLRSQHVALGSRLHPARFGNWNILCKLQSNNQVPYTVTQLRASNKTGTLVSICLKPLTSEGFACGLSQACILFNRCPLRCARLRCNAPPTPKKRVGHAGMCSTGLFLFSLKIYFWTDTEKYVEHSFAVPRRVLLLFPDILDFLSSPSGRIIWVVSWVFCSCWLCQERSVHRICLIRRHIMQRQDNKIVHIWKSTEKKQVSFRITWKYVLKHKGSH